MSEKFSIKSSFWKRIEEDSDGQERSKFHDINIFGFFLFWLITNVELFLFIFMLLSTLLSCCKKKNNQMNTDPKNFQTNPPSDNGTEDLIAGVPVNSTTGNFTTATTAATNLGTTTAATTGDGSHMTSTRPDATATGAAAAASKPNKTEIKEEASKIEKTKSKCQMKTAKAMPKNVWELAYPATITETMDENANTNNALGHTATKE